MTAMHDPFGSLGVPEPRGPHEQRPAADPWDTGERIFGNQWDTGEQRALEEEWLAGQQSRIAQRPSRVGHPRPARVSGPYVYSRATEPGHPVVSTPPAAASDARGGPNRMRYVTVLVVVTLLLSVGWQTWRLESKNEDLAAVVSAERVRSAALNDRTEKLERQLAGVFDPETISSAVLPSVFRVRAGAFTGTAFSVSDKAADGQANLLTNFHVIESVWESGNRKVFLERGKDELSATIVKVSRSKDLALLRASRDVNGLKPARATVKPGQQIVVVGAPLGLEDTVTTGVVSAYRPDDRDGPTIQFDAPINPGNSGGPVVNSSHEVVGLATAKARDAEGIGLAVPIKTACATFKVC